MSDVRGGSCRGWGGTWGLCSLWLWFADRCRLSSCASCSACRARTVVSSVRGPTIGLVLKTVHTGDIVARVENAVVGLNGYVNSLIGKSRRVFVTRVIRRISPTSGGMCGYSAGTVDWSLTYSGRIGRRRLEAGDESLRQRYLFRSEIRPTPGAGIGRDLK